MAITANAFSSYSSVGTREDLQDTIYDISPTETPFLTMCKRGSAKQTLHEWQTDSLDAAAANAQLEGDDYTFLEAGAAITPTTRLSNQCQISNKKVVISGTQEAGNHAGRNSEVAYQKARRAKELKRDMEVVLTGVGVKNTGSTTVARTLAGVESWIATNTDRGVTGADPSGNGTVAPTDGTARLFAETQVTTVLQGIFDSGGDPDCIMVGSWNKQKFSNFLGRATTRQNIAKDSIQASAHIYASDFGMLEAKPNRFMRQRTALVLDPEYWEVAYFRRMHEQKLAKTGDAEKYAIVCEYTLVSRNEAASGIIADLTIA